MRCVQEPGNTCCLDCGGGVGGEGRAGVCVSVFGEGAGLRQLLSLYTCIFHFTEGL